MRKSSKFEEMRCRVFEKNGMDRRCVGCANVQMRSGLNRFECSVFFDPVQAWNRVGGCSACVEISEEAVCSS